MLENLPHLYDYFQSCMIAITFSFQALEAFCNETITREVTGKYPLKRKKGHIQATAEKLQRNVSTEEKLGVTLPSILSRPSPKRSPLWEKFEKLKMMRDATVHMKQHEVYPRESQSKSFFYLLYEEGVEQYVQYSLDIIAHFVGQDLTPRWFALAQERIAQK